MFNQQIHVSVVGPPYNPLRANPTKGLNKLKQITDNFWPIAWVYLNILWVGA